MHDQTLELNWLFRILNNRSMKTQNIEALWVNLHWLTMLAQQGSFTAAAQRLGVSKAAMSQRISELERAAGVPLVQRTTRSVRLTEPGQRLVDELRQPFDHIAQSFAAVKDEAGLPRGLVRVTAPVAFARQQLVPRMGAFLRDYPEVRIELELSDSLRSLAVEGFDIALRHTAVPPDTHVALSLCRTRSVLVATKAYLRKRGTPKHPQDLAAHDCLHYPRAQEKPVWHFESRGRSDRPPSRISVAVSGPLAANNSEALRDAALSGLGIALLPDFTAQMVLRSEKLVEVLPRWQTVGAFADQLFAIRPYSTHVPRAVAAFSAWLRAELADGFPT